MKHSARAKRMQRHQGRLKKQSSLNLVSLMDIFTILVFFLLVNSSDVEVLEANKDIKLPDSVSEKKPEDTLVVMLNNEQLIVQGRKVADVAAIMGSQELTIAALEQELQYQASKRPVLTEEEQKKGRAVTIMGDKAVPYQLLKRVMTTCAGAEYRNISLAVNKVESDEEPGPEQLQAGAHCTR
jgi:biopolymer transport protein ExbD